MTQPIHNPDPSAGKQATLLEAFTRFKNITTVLLAGLHGQERIAIMQEYCELVESIPEMIKRESAFADLASGHLAGRIPVPPVAAVEPASKDDEWLIASSIEIIAAEGKASTSQIQRRLSLGYTRAARILDILEARGYVGPCDGAKPREILRKVEVARNSEKTTTP